MFSTYKNYSKVKLDLWPMCIDVPVERFALVQDNTEKILQVVLKSTCKPPCKKV